jgi:RimJ/RimL family protein N-acetyltransferase
MVVEEKPIQLAEFAVPQPSLETKRLVLRPFELNDARDVFRICSQKEIAANTRTIPHPYPQEEAAKWISKHQKLWESGKAAVFAICQKLDQRLIGAIGLSINQEDQNAELGYWIDTPFWNNGFCTEAGQAVVRFGLIELSLHKIHAHFMTRNPASGRVMVKIGMKREGLLREHVRKWGVFENIVLYGMLKSDLELP